MTFMNWRPSSSSRRASTSCYSESLRSHAGVSGQGTGCVTCSAVVMLLLQAQMLFPVHWCHRWWRRPLNRMTVLLSTRTVVGENTTQWTCVCVFLYCVPFLPDTYTLHFDLWNHCTAELSGQCACICTSSVILLYPLITYMYVAFQTLHSLLIPQPTLWSPLVSN